MPKDIDKMKIEEINLKKLKHDINSVYFKLELASRILDKNSELTEKDIKEIAEIIQKNSLILKLISQFCIYEKYSKSIDINDKQTFINIFEEMVLLLNKSKHKEIIVEKKENSIIFAGDFRINSEIEKLLILLAIKISKSMYINLKIKENVITLQW